MTETTREALTQRISTYLAGGGLFNPELADHDAVRDLLIDCRDALAAPSAEPVALPCRDCETPDQCVPFDHCHARGYATPAQQPAAQLTITMRQAERLLRFFGGHDAEVAVAVHGNSLRAWCVDCPEEGSEDLGPTEVDDDLAMHGTPAAPSVEPEPAWVANKAAFDAMEDGQGPYMHRKNLEGGVPVEWPAFKSWAENKLGQGYSLACCEGALVDSVTSWCFTGFQAGMEHATQSQASAEMVAEACAKICDERAIYYRGDDDGPRGEDDPDDVKSRRTAACEACSAAIRNKIWSKGPVLDALSEEQIADAKRWGYVRAHWTNAQFHWYRDQSLKSVVLTIKAAHQGASASVLEREIDEAIERAHGIAAPGQEQP